MTEKRFIIDDDGIVTDRIDLSMYIDNEDCCEKLNELHEENIELHIQNDFLKDENQHMRDLVNENKQLKKELKIYRKIANCSNCKYQGYDWFDDGDEFEICRNGNNEQQIDYHICKDWEEL